MDMVSMSTMKSFADTCCHATDIVDFRKKIYPQLKQILPHNMFAFGTVRNADRHIIELVNLTFPSGYLANTGSMTCPALLRWVECRNPVHIDANSPSLQLSNYAWYNYFKLYDVKNLSVHGVTDLDKKYSRFFVFGGINSWTAHEVSMLQLLTPQLYCAVVNLKDFGNTKHEKILTPREEDVLREICKGKSNIEVASTLHISPWTVKIHVSNLISKLKVSNRGHAIAKALELGLLEA